MADDLAAMQAYYARDEERERLDTAVGRLEYARTNEIVQRTLPPPPATVADIGGGPGRYTDWLVAAGYSVILRDVVADHVDQVRDRHDGRVDAAWGDARSLDLADASVDGVLLLGPMYHLQSEGDRRRALREAARIVRPGGVLHVAAISRWATRLHGILLERFDRAHPQMLDMVDEMERSGRLPPVHEASFTGYSHRPEELREEIVRAGLTVESLVGVEGPGFLLGDLEARLDDPDERRLLLDTLRAVEGVPELIGLGPHLLATARPPVRARAPSPDAARSSRAGGRSPARESGATVPRMEGGARGDHGVIGDDRGVAADVNMAETWSSLGRLAGRPIDRVGSLRLFASGIPAAFFNGAMATGPTDDPERCVARALEFMATNDVPWLLWVREGVDDALLAAGRAAGLRDAGGPPAMVWAPIPPPRPVVEGPDLEVSVVDDLAGLQAHRDLMTRAFEMPRQFVEQLLVEAMLDEPGFAIVLGRVGGEPVSTAMVSVTGTTAGVYNVATPLEHQRRGYGRALTRAAVDEGLRRGCDHAILQASPAGQPVYEEMGFVHVGRYVQLEGPPA